MKHSKEMISKKNANGVAVLEKLSEIRDHELELEQEIEEKTKELNKTIRQLKSYKDAMDVNSIVTIADTNGKIKYANEKFYEVSKFSPEEVIGKNHNIVRHPDVPKDTFKEMWKTIQSKKIWHGKLKNITKDGQAYIVQAAIVPILDENGDIEEYIATRYEITEIINKKDEIERLSKTDILTGLYNRFYLNETLKNYHQASIALIDINSFHEINDFYGDRVGDSVIVELSKILYSRLKERYMLFHLCGDEFIVFNINIERDVFINEMIEVNNYLNSKTLMLQDKVFFLNTTMSLSFDDLNNLLPSVHLAKAYAKQNALSFNIYTTDNPLEREYQANLDWSNRIKKAINDDRITVFFQPIVDTVTKETVKYETLVRMIGKNGEVISPYFFLDKAKKSKQYTKISKIVIEKTLKAMTKHSIKCSINITIEDIKNSDSRNYIYEKLDSFERCEDITFELVESEGIHNLGEVSEFIKCIKSYGCRLAIDDFGTGYSNFEYLLKLNADIIKIDGSLIKEIDKNQDHYDIVKTIVNFAKIKGLEVVAEFVSSEAIYEKIKELNIEYCQGYYFAEPQLMEL